MATSKQVRECADSDLFILTDAELKDLVPLFLQNRKVALEKLPEALRTWDFEAVQQIGEDFCEISLNLGFNYLDYLGRELMLSAEEQDTSRRRK